MSTKFINDVYDVQWKFPHMDNPMYLYVGQPIAGVKISSIVFDNNALERFALMKFTVYATKGSGEFPWKTVMCKLTTSLDDEAFYIVTNSNKNKIDKYNELESGQH